MALTLLEAAKIHSGDVVRSSVIEKFAMSNDLMAVMPWEDIPGNSYSYTQEHALPGVAFRGLNEGYTASTGILNPQTERLKAAGGDLDVDRMIIRTMGEDVRTRHEMMKVKALSLNVAATLLKGDEESDPKEFDGLQKRLVGDQLVSNADAGAALSLAKLDEAIDAVDGPTHLIMNKTMGRLLSAAARTTSVAGNLTWDKNEFGKRVMAYNDMPILFVDYDESGAQVLPFTEDDPGGASDTCTSIYCVRFGDNGVMGIQNGTMEAYDLGELEDKPVYRTRVEWYMGMAVLGPRSASRLYGVKNGAVTA